MKIFLLCVVLSVFAGVSARNTRLAESKILAKIEALRQEYIEKGFDPYNFENTTLTVDNLGLNLEIISTGVAKGALQFDIPNFTFNIKVGGGYKFTYTIRFSVIDLNIDQYNLNGWYGILPLFGNGSVDLKVSGLILKGEGELGVLNKEKIYVYLDKIITNVKADHPDFKISGWLDDESQSAQLTDVVKNNVEHIFGTKQNEINARVEELILKYTEGKSMPLEDLIG